MNCTPVKLKEINFYIYRTKKGSLNLKPTIKLSFSEYNQAQVVKIDFGYHPEIISRLKLNTAAKWDDTMNCWYLPKAGFNLNTFYGIFKGFAFIGYSNLKTKSETKTAPLTHVSNSQISAIKKSSG